MPSPMQLCAIWMTPSSKKQSGRQWADSRGRAGRGERVHHCHNREIVAIIRLLTNCGLKIEAKAQCFVISGRGATRGRRGT
jgi:hypothetical protein